MRAAKLARKTRMCCQADGAAMRRNSLAAGGGGAAVLTGAHSSPAVLSPGVKAVRTRTL